MLKNKNRVINYIKAIEKLYHMDFSEDLKSLENDIIDLKNYSFIVLKSKIKEAILNYSLWSETSINNINLKDFRSCFGGVDLVKLDARLYNELIPKVKNLHNLSGVEKLKIYCNSDKFFKKIYRLI